MLERGRSSPRWLGWRAGTFAQIDTPHFVIYSRAAEEPSRRRRRGSGALLLGLDADVLSTLGRCATGLRRTCRDAGRPIRARLSQGGHLADHDSTQVAGRLVPKCGGVPDKPLGVRCRALSDRPDITTIRSKPRSCMPTSRTTRRRAAMKWCISLFREATRSGLGRSTPGEDSGFWLVEGIAGYFESLAP